MRAVVLAKRPNMNPKPDDFEIREMERPKPDKDELLVRLLWLSVDPYVRLNLDETTIVGTPGMPLGTIPLGRGVFQVVESHHTDYAPGEILEGTVSWAEYAIIDLSGNKGEMHFGAPKPPKKIDLGDLPLSYAVGALGMPGQTAYAGIVQTAKVAREETILISAAAGAVGTLAGQIAKLYGARVVGIAGGPDKCAAVKALGFDECVDYKTSDFDEQLAAALPDGFNVYFENVGGDLTLRILPYATFPSRMALCGIISIYGSDDALGPDRYPQFLRAIFAKGMTINHFHGESLAGPEETAQIRRWIEARKIVPRETIIEGIEKMPEVFSSTFGGNDNIGKVVLRLADAD